MRTREYKFKIWSFTRKKFKYLSNGFTYKINADFNSETEMSETNAPYLLFNWDGTEIPCVIMQFTGRQDMKGVDIYDHDIIKRYYKEFNFDTNEYNQKEAISYVEYLDRGFWIKDESFGWEGEDLWDWNKIEVIGNMFENPELYYLEK
jgi:uncharacterized phage protein (TIGR01671 family)